MAIQKSSNFKGVAADYWKIIVSNYDAINLKSYVVMGLYLSQATRESNVENYLTTVDFSFNGSAMTLAETYTKIKESKMENEIETNPFADAIDC